MRIPMIIRGPGIKENTFDDRIVGNIDILPTLLDIAGIKYDINTYDGRSWVGNIILKEKQNENKIVAPKWRDIFLSQYIDVGTQNFGFCRPWIPDPDTGSLIPGSRGNPPSNNSFGQTYMLDVLETGSWRALRIINETSNLAYMEFITWPWINSNIENPYFYELYDIDTDPYQIDNIYDQISTSMQNELHQMLLEYGACAGTNCW